MTENGKPMDFALDDDGYITVSIVATFGATYCIAVTESGNYEEKRRAERIRDFCIRLQNEYEFKRRLCGLLNDTEPSEWASAIKELPLTVNEKKRIMEICAGDAV